MVIRVNTKAGTCSALQVKRRNHEISAEMMAYVTSTKGSSRESRKQPCMYSTVLGIAKSTVSVEGTEVQQ